MPDHSFEVSEEEADERLDVVLARHLDLSRAQTRKLLERGDVRLDGSPVDRSVKGVSLVPGSRIEVAGFVHPQDQRPVPEPEAELRILAEGPGWVAVDKPAGTAVHPLEPEERGTLLNALVARRPEIQGVGEAGLRSGVLHRLDVGTSGVVFPAAELPRLAVENGATLVEINPEETAVSGWYGHHLRGPASEMLARLG